MIWKQMMKQNITGLNWREAASWLFTSMAADLIKLGTTKSNNFQQVARVELKPRTTGLRVQCTDHLAMLPLWKSCKRENVSIFFQSPLWGPLRELHMSLVWILTPVVSHIEEEAILLPVFYYNVFFLYRCRIFNPSLCCLSPFLLSYVTVSRPCCLLELTVTGPHL